MSLLLGGLLGGGIGAGIGYANSRPGEGARGAVMGGLIGAAAGGAAGFGYSKIAPYYKKAWNEMKMGSSAIENLKGVTGGNRVGKVLKNKYGDTVASARDTRFHGERNVAGGGQSYNFNDPSIWGPTRGGPQGTIPGAVSRAIRPSEMRSGVSASPIVSAGGGGASPIPLTNRKPSMVLPHASDRPAVTPFRAVPVGAPPVPFAKSSGVSGLEGPYAPGNVGAGLPRSFMTEQERAARSVMATPTGRSPRVSSGK